MVGSLIIVMFTMTPDEQGYFWVFLSMSTLLPVGELGLSQVVLQTASHYSARGEAENLHRFWRLAFRISMLLTPLAAILLLICGMFVFTAGGGTPEGARVSWQLPWLLFVLINAVERFLTPAVAFVEGSVSAGLSWRFQAALETCAGAALLLALLSHAGLWSLTYFALARSSVLAIFLATQRSHFGSVTGPVFTFGEWRREIWPYQWKVAVNTATSFLIFRSFNPIIFIELGPLAAGRFAVSLGVMVNWLSIAIVWPLSQTARLGRLFTLGYYPALRRAFVIMLIGSTLFAALGAASLLLGLVALQELRPAIAERIADFPTTGLLLFSAVIHHVIFCFAVLLRSGRQDPILPFTIFGSLFTFAAIWKSAQIGDLFTIAVTYSLCTLLGLLMTALVFFQSPAGWRGKLAKI